MKFFKISALVALVGLHAGAYAQADDFPQRPITMVVPYSAGGPTDVIARVLAEGMGKKLEQTVVVDNRPGASGLIATRLVEKAAPDGYTLLFTSLGHTVNPLLFKNAGYDPIKDFTPISLVASSPAMLVVGADQPYQSVDDLVKAARTDGTQLSYGSSGHGGSSHLTGELLKKQIGVDSIQHIPYKGNAPAVQDLIGGQISFMFYPVSAISELLASNRVRALATTASERDASHPSVPTMQELGYSGFEYSHPWVGMIGPADMPPAVVEKLSTSIQETVAGGKLRELLVKSASTPVGNSAAEFSEFLVNDTKRWGALIADAGIEQQ